MKEKNSGLKAIVIFLLSISCLLAFGIRFFLFLNTVHLDYESMGRIIFVNRYSENPFKLLRSIEIIEFGTGAHQGYYFLNSLLIHLFDRPIFVCRFSSLIFGLLVIIPYYLFIKTSFPIQVALCSVVTLALYPIHAQLSVVSMANAGCVLFIVLAGLFLNLYLSRQDFIKRSIYFFASIFFTILATSFRLEAWLLVVLFPLFLIMERKSKQAIIFFIFSSLYIWRTLSLFHSHMATFGFLENTLINPDHPLSNFSFWATRSDMPNYAKYQYSVWLGTLFYSFSSTFASLAFLGMTTAFKDKRQLKFVISFFSFFILLTVRQIISNQYPFMRYSVVLGIFFIPFAFLAIYKTVKYISHLLHIKSFFRTILIFSLLGMLLCYFALFSSKFLFEKIPTMRFSSFVNDLSLLIKKHVVAGDVIFSSFDSLTLGIVATLNNFICLDILPQQEKLLMIFPDKTSPELYSYIQKQDKYVFDKEIYNNIIQFVKECHAKLPGEKLNVRFYIRRNEPKEINHLIFILNQYDFNYLKTHFPAVFMKLKILDEKKLSRHPHEFPEVIVAVLSGQ